MEFSSPVSLPVLMSLGVLAVVPFGCALFLCFLVGVLLLKRIGPLSPSRSSVFGPFRDFPWFTRAPLRILFKPRFKRTVW